MHILARQRWPSVEKKKICSELAQILHDSLWHYSKHPCKKLLGKFFQTKFLWHGLVEVCTFLPPWADFGLGKARPWWGKKKKVARNWLKFCMIVYDTILSIHAKNCSENSFKRSFYGTAWSRCAHFFHHGLIFGLGGQKKKSSQNCLKFCMVVCGLIVSILAKNRGQIL